MHNYWALLFLYIDPACCVKHQIGMKHSKQSVQLLKPAVARTSYCTHPLIPIACSCSMELFVCWLLSQLSVLATASEWKKRCEVLPHKRVPCTLQLRTRAGCCCVPMTPLRVCTHVEGARWCQSLLQDATLCWCCVISLTVRAEAIAKQVNHVLICCGSHFYFEF
jgi:hypothetical protein